MMKNPVTRVASREAYRGKLVRVRTDDVILPRGTPDVFEFVEIRPGASVLPIDEDGRVWLIREWKYAVNRPSVETVTGGIEDGEDPLDAAKRELREEAGLEAAEWISLGHIDPFTSIVQCPMHMFIARGITPANCDPEEGEVIEILRMPFTDAVELVRSGGITHGTSCTLILKASQFFSGLR